MSEIAMPEEFKPLLTDIAALVDDPINARTHDERNLQAIEDSLRTFGWRSVVVARRSDKMLLAGHGRVAAAKRIGCTQAPVVFVDATDKQARAYALADNRTGELARWDFNVLQQVIDSLDDVQVPGFNLEDIDALLGAPVLEDTSDAEIEDLNEQGRQRALQKHRFVTVRLRVPKEHSKDATDACKALAEQFGGEVL